MMILRVLLRAAETQEHHPPTPVVCLHEIGMPYALDEISAYVAMGENGIARTGDKRSPHTLGAGNGFHVPIFCPAFRNHEIVQTVNLI